MRRFPAFLPFYHTVKHYSIYHVVLKLLNFLLADKILRRSKSFHNDTAMSIFLILYESTSTGKKHTFGKIPSYVILWFLLHVLHNLPQMPGLLSLFSLNEQWFSKYLFGVIYKGPSIISRRKVTRLVPASWAGYQIKLPGNIRKYLTSILHLLPVLPVSKP